MLGLLIKDLKLLKNQKSFFMMLIAFAFFFLFVNHDPLFVINYATILSCLFVVSSISYDEFNNSSAFLFTLPITRKEYTIEKYVFGGLLGISAWFFSTAVSIVYSYMNVDNFQLIEWIGTCSFTLLIATVFMSAIIPVQLKFGQNKGNIAMVICMGGIAAIGFVGIKVAELLGIDIMGVVDSLIAIGAVGLMVIIITFVLVCLGISYSISLTIMKKKQF